ncbi:uncharacterized protein SAZU_8121 [Streptomyces azureus]|uniref:Uncharacterized protein n=1 Tax=Streptomyces azureus TaxID=146537 RepID=A0A0K8PZB5_STRAJ|nr:uncharacterized protein SAZU_8121 [Streptomyces azureus]
MDATVLGALIGLVGVSAGAGATFGGVVYQQRHASRAAETARRRGEAVTAAEKLLAELLVMQQNLRRGAYDVTGDEVHEYNRARSRHHATVQLHSQWLPDAELRTRLGINALYTQIGPAGDPRSDVQRRADGMSLCLDSIACLGAFLRSEPIPQRDAATLEVLARWPQGQSMDRFIVSGPSVSADETPNTPTG